MTPRPLERWGWLLSPDDRSRWRARALVRALFYAVLGAAGANGWIEVPWATFAVLVVTSAVAFAWLAALAIEPDHWFQWAAVVPDLGLLFLLTRVTPHPDPWAGLAYVWVAGLSFGAVRERTGLVVVLLATCAWAALALGEPRGPGWIAWAVGHAIGLGLMTALGTVMVRERLELRHDPLTGVLDRRSGLAALERRVQRGEAFYLAFVDLRGFKSVNDRHGHAVGDEVLAAVAGRLAGAVRRQDPVLRFGGDEFLIASHHPDLDDRLRNAVQGPVATSVGRIPIEADVGISRWAPGDSLTELVQEADERMYGRKGMLAPQ
ncbi:MAG: GGDEF domain-containing protein [Trueperaceae bacterium]|nr:GGDEF domain-containing protein [Trueperaceae bacterium]